MHVLVAIGFGMVAISALFLVIIFWRAWRDEPLRDRKRYRVVSGSLMVGKVGIFLWALNPLLWAFGYARSPAWLMISASALILAAAVTLIGSTAMGGDRKTLNAFLLSSFAWTAACVIWGVLLA